MKITTKILKITCTLKTWRPICHLLRWIWGKLEKAVFMQREAILTKQFAFFGLLNSICSYKRIYSMLYLGGKSLITADQHSKKKTWFFVLASLSFRKSFQDLFTSPPAASYKKNFPPPSWGSICSTLLDAFSVNIYIHICAKNQIEIWIDSPPHEEIRHEEHIQCDVKLKKKGKKCWNLFPLLS